MQRMTKPTMDRVMSWKNITKNMLELTQHIQERHATLMSHKWDYTTHIRSMQKMTKPAMDRVKAGRKSNKKVPEPDLKSKGIHAPLIG